MPLMYLMYEYRSAKERFEVWNAPDSLFVETCFQPMYQASDCPDENYSSFLHFEF